ncbi:MBL fold metallo-hydrolase [Paenibacillus sp. SYP-B3998]|uniref:MBL fold metallo-hydrolase n=1 Tax=Paenibacillus sp. SYP-B3998 TaxID=2678564 RepID=A0A6G3ZRB2_9BACL|nr:MBL fold metallo-hydrolase [Paenibacillus sp. SYP-B3998]NEW04746.1 MBL fold metallo-hydrolase [Paenibacillus sp. SYP-B3998]
MNMTVEVKLLKMEVQAFGHMLSLYPLLIWDGEDAVLVDTGMPGMERQIMKAIEDAGVPLSKLKSILLTHHDIDHIGSLPAIIEQNAAKIMVYAHELERPYIEGLKPLMKMDLSQPSLQQRLQSLPPEAREKTEALCMNPPKAPVNKLVAGGDIIPLCGGIYVIETPGHTLGHISFYLPKSKTLIAGDAMIAAEGRLKAPKPADTPDMKQAVQSLERLKAYEIETVICYHGGLFQGDVQGEIDKILVETIV